MDSYNDFLIWWTHNALTSDKIPWVPGTPAYIIEQFENREGRSGRGRLWCAEGFPEKTVGNWPKTGISKMYAQFYGGIVIRSTDIEYVRALRAIGSHITSMDMRRVPKNFQNNIDVKFSR